MARRKRTVRVSSGRQSKKSNHVLVWIVVVAVVVFFVFQFSGRQASMTFEDSYAPVEQESGVQCNPPQQMIQGQCCRDADQNGVCDLGEMPMFEDQFAEVEPTYTEKSFPVSSLSFPVKSASTLAGSVPVALGGWVGPDDDPVLGKADASVVVIEFGNYQCIPCSHSHKHIFPSLKKDYIDTGKVVYVARDYVYASIVSEDGLLASIAANCAREEGKFWEMRDLLFKYSSQLSYTKIVGHAKSLGLNLPQFHACLDGGYRHEIYDDYQEGKDAGMKAGSSMFYVNGYMVPTTDYDTLKMTIDNILSGKWT